MDIVLGVSMAPATIRMVVVEGENAHGVTVDEDRFRVDDANDPATLSAPDQVIAAILGTREGAGRGGHQLTSTGVTWTDPSDAAALATALAARKVENVMLVSAFLSAAALAQTVGYAIGYKRIAMLFVEPDTATLAVVNSTDGSVTDVHRRPLRGVHPVPELVAMIAGLHAAETYAEGLFIVGCDVDIAPIKPTLEAASYLPVSTPEEPDMALARGAALASANAPLFASSTAALAYAQDPGTGEVDPYAVSPGYLEVPVALRRRPAARRGSRLQRCPRPGRRCADRRREYRRAGRFRDEPAASTAAAGRQRVGGRRRQRCFGSGDRAGIGYPAGGRVAAYSRPSSHRAGRGGACTAGGATPSGAASAGRSCGATAGALAGSRADRSALTCARADSRRTRAGAHPGADARGDSGAASPRPA